MVVGGEMVGKLLLNGHHEASDRGSGVGGNVQVE